MNDKLDVIFNIIIKEAQIKFPKCDNSIGRTFPKDSIFRHHLFVGVIYAFDKTPDHRSRKVKDNLKQFIAYHLWLRYSISFVDSVNPTIVDLYMRINDSPSIVERSKDLDTF